MDQKKRDAVVNRIKPYEGFVPRIYRDTEGVPTIGYGLSLTDKNFKPWDDLGDRLRQIGLDGYEDKVRELLDDPKQREQIEYWSPNKSFTSEPLGGVVISGDQARQGLSARVEQDYEKLRDELGYDAKGVYHLDKLNEAQLAAVMDAYYRNPNIIGERTRDALRHQEDPDFQSKMRTELNDVKQLTRRARDDANAFIPDPPPGFFNDPQMLKSPLENPVDSQGGQSFWNEMERKLKDGMAPLDRSGFPVAQGSPRDDDASETARLNRPSGGFTSVAWSPSPPDRPMNLLNNAPLPSREPEVKLWDSEADAGPAPGNLLNANALPANLLSMAEAERRKWRLW